MLRMKTTAALAFLLIASHANALYLECYGVTAPGIGNTVEARMTWNQTDVRYYPSAYMYTTVLMPDGRYWKHSGNYFLPDADFSAVVHRLRTPGVGRHVLASIATSWRWERRRRGQVVNPDRPKCSTTRWLP